MKLPGQILRDSEELLSLVREAMPIKSDLDFGEDVDFLNHYYWKESTNLLDKLASSGKLYSEDFNF